MLDGAPDLLGELGLAADDARKLCWCVLELVNHVPPRPTTITTKTTSSKTVSAFSTTTTTVTTTVIFTITTVSTVNGTPTVSLLPTLNSPPTRFFLSNPTQPQTRQPHKLSPQQPVWPARQTAAPASGIELISAAAERAKGRVAKSARQRVLVFRRF